MCERPSKPRLSDHRVGQVRNMVEAGTIIDPVALSEDFLLNVITAFVSGEVFRRSQCSHANPMCYHKLLSSPQVEPLLISY